MEDRSQENPPALVYLEDYRYCFEFLPGADQYRKVLIADKKRPAKRTEQDPLRYFDEIHVIDTDSPDELRAILRRLSAFKIHRILASTEAAVCLGGVLREAFSVAGLNADEAVLFRDKLAMKDHLRQKGIATTDYTRVTTKEDLSRFVATTGFPIVLKPIDGYGTSQTWKVSTHEELERIWQSHDLSAFMAEKFVEGREFHVDSVVIDGELVFTSVGEYLVPLLESIRKNLIDGSIIYPASAKANFPFLSDLEGVQEQVLKAMNLRNGVAHGEYFMKADGSLLFGEVAPRVGGSTVISDSIEYTHGVNMFEAFVSAELGLPLTKRSPRRPVFVANICFPVKDGTIEAISSAEEMCREPGVVSAKIFAKVGETLAKRDSSMSRTGYAILAHDRLDELNECVKNAHEKFLLCTRN